jgi:hypothetical protein
VVVRILEEIKGTEYINCGGYFDEQTVAYRSIGASVNTVKRFQCSETQILKISTYDVARMGNGIAKFFFFKYQC